MSWGPRVPPGQGAESAADPAGLVDALIETLAAALRLASADR